MRSFALTVFLLGTTALAQNGQPGQVRMQIPLGGQTAQPAAAPVSQVYSSDAAMDTLLTEEVIRSLRDPFVPPAIVTKKEAPKSELEQIALKDFRLNGVITGPRKVRAMVSTSNGGKTFFLAVGDKLGMRSGRVTAIKSDMIKVVEYETDDRGRRIPEIFELRISGEIVSLSRKDEE